MATKSSHHNDRDDIPSGSGKRIGIVVSDWNAEVTSALLEGCIETLRQHDVAESDILVQHVPGSFELPLGARFLAADNKCDALICLGCIIKGETKHDEYIANAVATGIMQFGLTSNLPVIFGVLTPDTMEQAKARAGGDHGNKGSEAAGAALRMAALRTKHVGGEKKIGFS